MKNTLFNINEEHRFLMQDIENMDGEITPEIESRLIINAGQLQSKGLAYLAVIRNNESFVNQLDEEIKRLQGLKKRATTTTDYLKDRLLDAVKLHGNFEVEFTKFGTRKSESVEVENVNALPAEFKTVKIVEAADKIALKAAIKNGQTIEGVTLKENLNLKIN